MRHFSLAVAGGWALALALILPAPSMAAPQQPQPCFVPAHPKKARQLPTVETSRHAGRIPVGGAGEDYHDDHLTGVLQTANLTRSLKTLAILVDFDDEVMGENNTANPPDSTQLYFDRIMTFLDQMYGQMSDGQIVVDYTVTSQVYRLPESMAYYGLDDSIATREADLCRDAVEAADPDIDFSQYDTFMLFHAGAGQEADINDDSQEQIWSVFFRTIDFRFWLDAPDSEFGIRTNDIDPATSETFYVPHMVVLPETESQDGFDFGILGTTAHEFGHRFGLPDLYDTTAPEDFIFADSQGIGTFGLMGAGIWNANGVFPSEMCAWSKFYVGWLRPRVLRDEQSVSLTAAVQDRLGGAVRIPLGGDEYFLIENRIRDYNGNGMLDFDDANADGEFDFWTDSYAGAEFDWHLPQEFGGPREGEPDGSGLLIWHIDESVVRELIRFNLVNAEALHKGVDLEEADGIQDLDKLEFSFEAFGDPRDSFWAPAATAFTPLTTPNSDGYNDAHSAVWVTNISGPGNTMTFDLRFSSPQGDGTGDPLAGWPRDLPGLAGDFQPVAGDISGDGVQEILAAATLPDGSGGVVVLDAAGNNLFSAAPDPEFVYHGAIRSEPVLVDLDPPGVDPALEAVWVSGDSLLVLHGDGTYRGADGNASLVPLPYFRLAGSTGRVRLSAGHLEPTDLGLDDRAEILVGTLIAGSPDSSLVTAVAFRNDRGTHARVSLTYPGTAEMPMTLGHLDRVDGGLREMVTSVRSAGGGHLAVALYDLIDTGVFVDARALRFSPGDSVALGPPVVGDLNRDGVDDIVVADGAGFLHALNVRISTAGGQTKLGQPSGDNDNSLFEELDGWPVFLNTIADDQVSLADVDGDGYLEVLAFGPVNRLHQINYNGTSVVGLPVSIPGEERFSLVGDDIIPAPYYAPLISDLGDAAGTELVLPMQDGQVRGHNRLGQALSGWAYLGGGNQGLQPVVTDLDANGMLELISAEDITVDVPLTGEIEDGDAAAILVRRGRLLVRDVGAGSGVGPWPRYRADTGRIGRAETPVNAPGETAAGNLEDPFVMPNPVQQTDAKFHYRVHSQVQEVVIEVFSTEGNSVRTLTGTVFSGVDNVVQWDLVNSRGHRVAPGLYFARIQAKSGRDVETTQLKFVVAQ